MRAQLMARLDWKIVIFMSKEFNDQLICNRAVPGSLLCKIFNTLRRRLASYSPSNLFTLCYEEFFLLLPVPAEVLYSMV